MLGYHGAIGISQGRPPHPGLSPRFGRFGRRGRKTGGAIRTVQVQTLTPASPKRGRGRNLALAWRFGLYFTVRQISGRFQTRMVSSSLPVIRRSPSGVKTAAMRPPLCP